jgi:hypothetical protein
MKLQLLGVMVLGSVGLVALPACEEGPVMRYKRAPATTPAPGQPETQAVPAAREESPPVPRGPTGSLRGTVTFKGVAPTPAAMAFSSDPACEGMERTDQSVRVKNGRLENALVRVRGEVKGQPSTPVPPAVIDQHQCTYRPRVQGAVAGQPVVIKNSDGTLHNVRGYAGAKSVFNVAQPPMAKAMQRPLPMDVEVIRLKCDIHSWMTAWVVVNPNPYFATTNAEGSFDLEEVPVGTYTLEAWHEALGTKTAQVTVKEGQQATVAFEFSANDLKPASATAAGPK